MELLADRHTKSTPAAKLRNVFFWILVKGGLVFFVREQISQSIVL